MRDDLNVHAMTLGRMVTSGWAREEPGRRPSASGLRCGV